MKNKAILLVLLLVLVGAGYWLFGSGEDSGQPVVKYAEASDAADDFYHQWLKAAQGTSTEPFTALAKSPVLGDEIRDKIATALKSGATPDPVLCQSTVPAGITLRNVYAQADKAEILVTSKDKKITNQAVVTLNKTGDTWIISDIKCTNGDVAPEREFSFEKEGFLLKNSIPKPYNSQNWHLIFSEGGVAGNVVPLIFDAKSQCTNLDGTTAVCKPETFKETAKALVRGGMTEKGATVVKLQFVK